MTDPLWPHGNEIASVRLDSQNTVRVGHQEVTRIEGTSKSGMYADIPYIRVWRGNTLAAELCQHNVQAVTFVKKRTES